MKATDLCGKYEGRFGNLHGATFSRDSTSPTCLPTLAWMHPHGHVPVIQHHGPSSTMGLWTWLFGCLAWATLACCYKAENRTVLVGLSLCGVRGTCHETLSVWTACWKMPQEAVHSWSLTRPGEPAAPSLCPYFLAQLSSACFSNFVTTVSLAECLLQSRDLVTLLNEWL